MDLDALFTKPTGGARGWYGALDAAPKKALVELADVIVLRGREPNWNATWREFKKAFPEQTPEQAQTISDAVRRLVEARS